MKALQGAKISSGVVTEELRSIFLQRKVLSAGTALAAKLRVPMRERSSRLEQVEWLAQVWREWWMS